MNIISIIIPMYNEQENIANCIKVLKRQDCQNFVAIFINDGSIDKTQELLEEMIADKNIEFEHKVFEQKNSGAAAARKAGLDICTTEYIMFFDCDDRISSNMISEFYKTYEKNKDVDIILPDMQIQNENEEWEKLIIFSEQKFLDPIECLLNSIDGWKIHGCFTIKKQVILNSYADYLKYNNKNNNYVNNDEVITRLNFFNSKKIIRCKGIYYYNYNYQSTTKKVNSNKYLMIHNALILYNIFENGDCKLNKAIKSELISSVWGNLIYGIKHKKELNNIKDSMHLTKKTIKDIKFRSFFFDIDAKKKLQLVILKSANLIWINNEE